MAPRYNMKEYRVGALEIIRRFSTPRLDLGTPSPTLSPDLVKWARLGLS